MAGDTEPRPAGERTVQMLEDVGHRIGHTLAGVVHGVREVGNGLVRPDGGSPLERAEHLATEIGHRLSGYASLAGLELRRMTERIREEAADIRAEAEMRAGHPPSTQPDGETPPSLEA